MSQPGASRLTVGGRDFDVEVHRKIVEGPDAPRLVSVCYLASDAAQEITRVGIESILRHTPPPFELWVVDNNSDRRFADWLRDRPGINVILNRTTPAPPVRGL